MNRIVAFFLSSLLVLCGHLPTPKVEFVIHKNEGTLKQQIRATAALPCQIIIDVDEQKEPEATMREAVEATAAPKEENTLRAAAGAPEMVHDSFDDQAVGARLYIEIDAVVEMPHVEKVPVLRGKVGYQPEKAAEWITKLLLGDGPYIRPGHNGRAHNQLLMEYYQKWIEALDEKPYGPVADYAQIRQNMQQNFDANAESFRNADTSHDRPSQPWTGSFDDAKEAFSIGKGDRSFGIIGGGTLFSYGAGSHPYLYDQRNSPRGPRNEAEEQGLQNATAFANALGYTQVIPQYINDADEDTRLRNQVETGFDSGYKHFTLLPVYEGIPVYPYVTMYGSDTGRQAAGIPFARNLDQEEIFGTLYNGEVISLQWNSPFTVLSVENENVPLLSFERIMEIFRRQVFRSMYCDPGHDISYRITAIQFSYMRVQIRDSEFYYLLPVWDFTGYMVYNWQMSPGNMAAAQEFFHNMSILTINAVDGSILDRYLGC